MDYSNKFIIISGPTASGKSDLALKIANHQEVAIINADALQIYKSLAILSCQPNILDQAKIEHNLYSILRPEESSSVGLWLKLLFEAVKNAWAKNKLPLIVGGSGMYIAKLIKGIAEIPEITTEIKDQARNLYDSVSVAEFKQLLLAVGAEENTIINLDKQRLIRNYEVLKQTSKTISFWQAKPHKFLFPDAKFLHFSLNPDRNLLYNNCNQRFNLITKLGAIEEVENLMKAPIAQYSSIAKTIGYQEIRDFLLANINFEEMILIATKKTRNYAKRQLTWFRNQFQDRIIIENYHQELPKILSLIKNL